MMAAGALDEVAGLAELRLDPGLPVMRALGVAPLLRELAGDLSPAEAASTSQDRHPPIRQAAANLAQTQYDFVDGIIAQ